MMRPRELAAAAAGLVPFAVVWVAKVLVRPRPFWIAYTDPEMFFFYDGLRLLHGHAPANIDHPGTPMQLLAAAVAALTGATPLAIDRYRVAIYAATALLTVAATLLLVRGRLLQPLSMSMQITALWAFWSAPAALRYLAIASPEAIELPFAALAATAFAFFADTRTWPRAAWLGVATGAAMGVKFVFLSWLVAAGFAALLAGGATWREHVGNALAIGGGAAAGFALATCAAAARWPDMVRWISSVSTQSRWYGEPGTAPPSYAHSIAIAAGAAKAWHLWLAITLAMLVIASLRNRALMLPAIFCVTAVVANFASAAKGLIPTAAEGFGDIRYRYLLPSGMVVVMATAFLGRLVPLTRHFAFQGVVLALAAVVVGKATVAEIRTNAAVVSDGWRLNTAIERAVASQRRIGDVVVYAYTPTPSFALRFPTYDRRFMHLSVLAGDTSATAGPAFNPDFLRMIERRYPLDGHFFADIVSLPSGHTRWDLFVRRENDAEAAAAAPGTIVGRTAGYVIVRRSGLDSDR